MAHYYKLATGGEGAYRHDVDLTFDEVRRPVQITTTDGYRENYGGFFSAADALRHAKIFEYAKGSWILPYVARIAAGDRVSANEVLAHYATLHGLPPESFESEGE